MRSISFIDEFIQKCSNQYISNRLTKMSINERKERLKDKINIWEKNEYDYLLEQKEMYEFIEDWENSYIVEEYDYIKEQLLKYDKRIFRGYDLNKNKDKISSVNLDDFKKENIPDNFNEDNNNAKILEVEQEQVNNDNNIQLSDDEINAFKSYFGNDSTKINSELNNHYHDDYWLKLNEETRKNIHQQNNKIIPLLESAMNKSQGLINNTVLFHGSQNSGIINIHSRIGDKITLKSFISTSFHEDVGKKYGATVNDGPNLYVRFLAKTGVNGISGNMNHLSIYPTEHEFLLDKNQKGRIMDIDYDTGCVTVLLD